MIKLISHKLKVLVVLFTTAGTLAFGQTYYLDPGDTLYEITPFNNLIHFTIQQVNTTGGPIILSWEQISVNVPSGWTAYLCDNGNCFPNFPLSGTMDTVSGTDYGFLSVAIDPINITGTAIVRYAVWDNAIPNQKDTLTWIITANGTMSSSSLDPVYSFSVFPSLTNSEITIVTNNSENSDYFIIDNEGKLIITGNLSSTETKIHTDTLPDGIYFLSIIDENNNRSTKKILIQH